MGFATLVMRQFSGEDITVNTAVRRIRYAESFYIELPVVDRYFESRRLFSYQHNISTMVTDGPDIIQIRNNLPLNKGRVHVESMLYGMPSRDEEDVSKNYFEFSRQKILNHSAAI